MDVGDAVGGRRGEVERVEAAEVRCPVSSALPDRGALEHAGRGALLDQRAGVRVEGMDELVSAETASSSSSMAST